jgi:homoserine dehydrogenase
MANIAILGFGVVGSGVAEVITENLKLIEERINDELKIKYILDLRDFPDSPFGNLVTHDFNVILNVPEVSIVAEMMGGSHPAYDFSIAALKAGKSVVTSNKEVVSKFGVELLEVARENNVRYLFEASVGGGIPIIRPLTTDLAANSICSINGILNGTTNYILTQMCQNGADFADSLKDAQQKGYAEANPSADVDGIDAARKIVILASLAFGKLIDPDSIYTEGITKLSISDIEIAKEFGCSVKLIGHCEKIDGKIFAMVSPRLIPAGNPLHSIDDVFNGILVDGNMLGASMFYGRGAGKLPTASAVVADIIDIAKSPANDPCFPALTNAQASDIADIGSYKCKNMLVFDAKADDGILDAFNASEAVMKNGKVAFITEELSESELTEILSTLKDAPTSRIRMI